MDIPIIYAILAICTMFLVTGLNIGFCIVFAFKLKQLLFGRMENKHTTHKFKLLIIKNFICTMVGAISTVLSYILSLVLYANLEFGVIFIYSDLIINVVVIGLMFSHNKQYYEKCCKCCILFCFKLESTITKFSVEDKLEMSPKTMQSHTSRSDNAKTNFSFDSDEVVVE
eukprot:28252_1